MICCLYLINFFDRRRTLMHENIGKTAKTVFLKPLQMRKKVDQVFTTALFCFCCTCTATSINYNFPKTKYYELQIDTASQTATGSTQSRQHIKQTTELCGKQTTGLKSYQVIIEPQQDRCSNIKEDASSQNIRTPTH